jgi:hypothetical protein
MGPGQGNAQHFSFSLISMCTYVSQRILKVFGRGNLVRRPGESEIIREDSSPFQVFECEVRPTVDLLYSSF